MDSEGPRVSVRVVEADRPQSTEECLYPRDLKVIDVLSGRSNLHYSADWQVCDALVDQTPQEVESFAFSFRNIVQESGKNRVRDSPAAPVYVTEPANTFPLIEPSNDPSEIICDDLAGNREVLAVDSLLRMRAFVGILIEHVAEFSELSQLPTEAYVIDRVCRELVVSFRRDFRWS
jgi:hypothetical protein